MSDEVTARLSVWSEVQMICIWSSWCNGHPIIANLTISLECQWTDVSNNILFVWKYYQLFMHKRNAFLFKKNMPFKPMGMKTPQNLLFPLQHVYPHLIHPSLYHPHSLPPMAPGSIQPFCYNTLSGQTDRPTDGIGDNSIPRVLTLYYIVSNHGWLFHSLFPDLMR